MSREVKMHELCPLAMEIKKESADLEKPDVPRLAFLGFCDRLAEIRTGHPLFWHTNLVGISMARVSHVFPLNLNGQNLVCALYNAKAGEVFKLSFQSKGGQQPFEIDVRIGVGQVTQSEASISPLETLPEGSVIPGWTLVANAISADIIVYEIGGYDVFYLADGSQQYVGTAQFAHAPVTPFSNEEIAAIKSDPLGAKHIRISLTCKLCGESLRTYTGLARQESVEKEGWLWSQGLQNDRFVCKCGKTNFSLIPIRTGLHGLLRRNLNAAANPHISTVRQYEQSALEESCRRFFQLINSNPGEEAVQKFLEANPTFFHLFVPEKLMVKSPVLTKYFVDFAILNNRKELLLIEIEKPGLRLLKKDGGITADLQHALDQVRSWIHVFNDHRVAALDGLNLKLDEVAKVRGIVIAGRKPSDEARARALRSTSWGEIEVFTYDDLLRGTTEIIKQVARV